MPDAGRVHRVGLPRAGQQQPSPVLLAMGRSDRSALAAFRLSLGRWTTHSDVQHAARVLAHHAR